MRRKKSDEPAAPPRADGRVTPMDVQQVEFRLGFRGYNERDVDAFLDRITEDLSWYLEENQRLRAAPASTPAALGPDARAEAESVLAQAREEAAELVRRAERDAAAIRASAGAGAGDPRAAVAPFLNGEREFLQRLGSLVQEHAEDVKEMVLSLRARSAATSPSPAEPGPAAEAAESGAASAAEIRERLGEPGPGSTDAEPAPVIIEDATEPAYSSEGAPVEGRERSLRELFWGDD